MMVTSDYELVVGLEVHIQLNTLSKMFCGCSNDAVDKEPNTLLCPVCFGMPGTLPVTNFEAVRKTLLLGKALNATLADKWNFERKNYFYPDLPKGYQITSSTNPPIIGGSLQVRDVESGVDAVMRIHHIHLEEDAGKLSHGNDGYSYVDLNRSGTPLIEMVTEPDFRSPGQVKSFLQEIQLLVRTLLISAGDMENGHLRCDANVSVHMRGAPLGVKVEIKNLNSFSMVEKAIKYEEKRQIDLLEQGKVIVQETRSWDESKLVTLSLRNKEEAQDYRYVPEPDLPPIERMSVPEFMDEALTQAIKQLELPSAKRQRLHEKYGLTDEQIEVLMRDSAFTQFAEHAFKDCDTSMLNAVKSVLFGDVYRIATQESIRFDAVSITGAELKELVTALQNRVITQQLLKTEIAALLKGKRSITELLALAAHSQSINVESIIDEVMHEYASVVKEWQSGNTKVYGFLVGQVMAKSKGQADPQKVNEHLTKKLQQK